ncbi:hypothetical protein [Rhodococcus sp. NPDC055024]
MPWFQVVQVVVLTAVALIGLPAAVYANYSVRLRHEHELKRLLDISEKLPESAAGRTQIKAAIEEAALELAYILEYPRTTKDKYPPIVFGVLSFVVGGVAVVRTKYDVLLGLPNSWTIWLVVLQYVLTYLFWNSLRNSVENTRLTRGLFVRLNAPQGLLHGTTRWIRRVHQPGVGDALEFGAAIRDRTTDRTMTTIEAVNLGTAEARSEVKRLRKRLREARMELLVLKLRNFVKRRTFKVRLKIQRTWFAVMRLRVRWAFWWEVRKIRRSNKEEAEQMRTEFEQRLSEISALLKESPNISEV